MTQRSEGAVHPHVLQNSPTAAAFTYGTPSLPPPAPPGLVNMAAPQPLPPPAFVGMAPPPPIPSPAAPPKRYSVDQIWTAKLGRKFTPVSAYFLANMHRIAPEGGKGLTPTEAMTIIQLLSFKWDGRAPKPALRTIAMRLGLSVRTLRDTVKRLEDLGLVQREYTADGGCNRYHFDGLFTRLEQLMAQDADTADKAEEAAA